MIIRHASNDINVSIVMSQFLCLFFLNQIIGKYIKSNGKKNAENRKLIKKEEK